MTATTTTQKRQIKKIEQELRKYRFYKAGLTNLRNELNFIMPDVTASFELSEGSTGTFNIKSDTEKYAIDRIESRKALMIHETIAEYQLKVEAIEVAMKELKELERKFVEHRYFDRQSIQYTAIELNANQKYIFDLRKSVMNKFLTSLIGLIY